jgi:hypothetical protein
MLGDFWGGLYEAEADKFHAHQCIITSSKFSNIINVVGVAKYYEPETLKDL